MKKIDFNKDILRIDNVEKMVIDLQDFIREQVVNQFNKKGVVVGVSGGIDSAVTAALCSRALGPDKVLGLTMPEKESDPKSKAYAELVINRLGIKSKNIDLTAIVEAFNVYQIRDSTVKKNYANFDNSCKYRVVVPSNLLTREGLAIPHLEVLDKSGDSHKIKLSLSDYLTLTAATTIKIRTRMVMLYFHAEMNNFLVAGTTNKSEFVQGYYVKYGDGGVDIDPLTSIYKTQIYQLAEYLDIPKEVIQRKATPDTWSFEVSDEEFFFGLPYETVDLLWYAKENNIPINEIEKTLNLTKEQIERIFDDQQRKWKKSTHIREMPPSWNGYNSRE